MEKAETNQTDWIKQKLKTVWTSPKFCGLCLEDKGSFCSIDMEIVISNQSFSKCLQDIINYVFNYDIEDFMSSNHLCDSCTKKTIQSYIFIHNSKQLSRVIRNCVTDIDSKVVDISEQLDIYNKTNYDAASNVMIVLEHDTNLCKTLIDEQNPHIVPTQTPILMKETIKKELIIPEVNEKPPETEQVIQKLIKKSEKPVIIEVVREVDNEPKTVNATPNITLEEGHLVIKPLTSKNSGQRFFNTYECGWCSDIFTSYRSLKEHEKAKHRKSVFHCKLCDKSYNTQQYLNIHYKTHEIARCKLCQIILPETELMDHLRNTHTNLVYPCKFCDLVYYTQESVDTHFKITHLVNDKKAKSQCIMCLRNFSDSELKKHKCKFSCSECFQMPCLHYRYLMSFREQVLNHANRIRCIDCDYVTRRKEHLIGHVNREHLDHHPFTCADCSQQFYTKLSLKTHIKQFHQDFFCPYCDVEFKDNNTLESHKRACMSAIRTYSCQQCVASFDTSEELEKHEKLQHNEGVYACNMCKYRFLTDIRLKEHQARVHGGIQCKKRRKHIECSLCDIMFKTIKELLQHEQLHSPDDMYPCKVCPKKFKTLMKLYVHNQRHYTTRIICPRCKKKVASSFYAQHSVRCPYKNSVMVSHVCEVCGKSFHLESLLRLHQRAHMDPEPCPYCQKAIKPSSLKKHIEQFHGDPKLAPTKYPRPQPNIPCEICGHLVRKKCDLEAHMNRYHLKIKPYVCNICNKSFCGKVRLKEHIATHSKDKSCFCSVCGKKFANRVCLKMHFRMHTGELPYSCDICNQKFRSSSMMKTHRLKKHLEKTVICPLCSCMFYMVRDMRHHFKKTHWKPDEEGKPFNPRDVKELSSQYYHLFEDGRLPKVTDK